MFSERTREQSETTDEDEIESHASEQQIDRQPGSGSLSKQDAWVAETERDGMNDGRYGTRTTFYADDVDDAGPSQLHRDPEDRRSWDELAKWNDGLWEPDRKEQNFGADVDRWIDTFCSVLELPRYQRERVRYVVDDVDFERVRPHRYPVEYVIVGAISLVVDSEAEPDDIEEWDIDDWIVYDDDFESLVRDLEMVDDDGSLDREALWTVRKIIVDESSYFDG